MNLELDIDAVMRGVVKIAIENGEIASEKLSSVAQKWIALSVCTWLMHNSEYGESLGEIIELCYLDLVEKIPVIDPDEDYLG